MSNFGPDTNNSQFFITRTDCPNLDGTHVVCGQVLRGFDIILEMEKETTDEGTPTAEIKIVRSGELQPEEPWDYYDLDDNLPPFPNDWTEAGEYTNAGSRDPQKLIELLETIKQLGNRFYTVDKDIVAALRKYKKVGRYLQFMVDANATTDEDSFAKLRIDNLLNLAACHLKLGQYRDVILDCNEVIRTNPDHSKAYYRRGVAAIEMKDYDAALEDLKQAHARAPNDPNILEQFNRGKALLLAYRETEKVASKKMFR